MLSTSHGFLFVHVPKTAGNAIQDALRRYSDDALVCLAPHHDGIERFELRSASYRTEKHSTLQDYAREYGDALTSRLFKFACIRNPWDRCMSHYFSPHRGRVRWNKKDFIAFVGSTVQPLRHYLSRRPDAGTLQDALARMDFLVRYEHLHDDFRRVCRQIGLPEPVLHVRNASPEAGHRRHYDAETIDIVAQKFVEEIRCLDYAFA